MFRENKNLKKTIQNMFQQQKFENMIVVGGECMGKTNFLKYIIHNFLKDNYKFLFIHYLDDKGIDMIRNRIKHFTNLKSNKQKFVLIDDADDLSTSAQQSLRRIMEEKLETCSFIFTLNNFKNLIFPIHSRCLLFELQNINIKYSFIQEISIVNDKKKFYKILSNNEVAKYSYYSKIMNHYKETNIKKYIEKYNKNICSFDLTNLQF